MIRQFALALPHGITLACRAAGTAPRANMTCATYP